MVREISSQTDFEETIKNNDFVLVDFHAHWCGPCRAVAPILENMEAEVLKTLEAAEQAAATEAKPDAEKPEETAQETNPANPEEEKSAKGEKKVTKVAFIKVDVDNFQELAVSKGVAAMPTFFVFKNGELIKTIVGANVPAIKDIVKDNTGVDFAA